MMKVHCIASRPTLENNIDTLRSVIKIIHTKQHSLAHDWVEVGYNRLFSSKQPIDWGNIYKQNLEAIAQADVIIAEATHENFAIGYEVATAIQQKKPVLILRQATADDNVFVSGLEDGWVHHAKYNETNLESIIENFLDENDIKLKDMRFNFFIDRKIHNYLRWASFKTGKTKAEILRSLIDHEIEKQDYRPQ